MSLEPSKSPSTPPAQRRVRPRPSLAVALAAVVGALAAAYAVYASHAFYHRHISNDHHRILQELGSARALQVDVTLKRPTLRINGQDKLHVLVKPVQGKTKKYDAKFTVAGSTESSSETTISEFVFLNGVAYESVLNATTRQLINSSCVSPTVVPPLDAVRVSIIVVGVCSAVCLMGVSTALL